MAEKDKKMLKRAGLEKKAKALLNIIAQNPFQTPPPYEKLLGNLEGNYSGRINIPERIVYEVYETCLLYPSSVVEFCTISSALQTSPSPLLTFQS